ncbi:GNAT family N-acetyltransferase [Pseudomonas promysalinigenes]|uniref:GNAT family N-acetyltransferase n=1 Tax=Pseudomonas promysalinigenes TaxID=485898 RepID=UPI0037C888E6
MYKDAVTLRALHPDDMPFIERLFAGSRSEEMSHSGWPAEQIKNFLRQQFNAQHTYYQAHYADGQFLIVELDGQPIGRLYLFWGATTLNLIEICLLPEFQKRGIGSMLIEAQLYRADQLGLNVELFVEYYNPAQRLYARLGFYVCGDSGVYLKLRRDARVQARKVS